MRQTAQQSLRRFAKVNEIIHEHGSEPAHLISILQDVQEEYRYLPEEILAYVATAMDISQAKVFGVATFYENFSLHPKGKYVIKVCDGTACHVRKSQSVIDAIRTHLNLKDGAETTEDFLFTLEIVSCLGACGLAPVILVNDKVYGKVSADGIKQILDKYRRKADQEE